MVAEDISWKEHTSTKVIKANRILGMLKRVFICRDPSLWKDLKVPFIRLRLEYAVQGVIKKIEMVQEFKSNKDPLWVRLT